MKPVIKFILLILMAAGLASCADYTLGREPEPKPEIVKTVAVVLPMEHGLSDSWRRCLSLYSAAVSRAYKAQDVAVRLDFEFYDESGADLEHLAAELGARSDIYAVIGGLYSSNAAVLTDGLARVGKTLFTLATAEDLIRGYASTGCLWAMTETDITQCEVLLSRVSNYGGHSVALIAKEDDIYGKTFIDWFAFQTRELGLENAGLYTYADGALAPAAAEACLSGADYVICVPSEAGEVAEMLDAYRAIPWGTGTSAPRLLFSDTAFGTDVLSICGERAEGLEGVAFGADPESGFDVSYKTFYGVTPTTGEAQLYDVAMLLGYAAWHQYLHPEATLTEALRSIVTGQDINMGSWMAEDMSLVIDAMADGASPRIKGASGELRFDKKIFTNVLSTTYYNYRIYEGEYVILDYNTTDGGNRTDATLAGWNWKASQMQEFDDGATVAYGPHTDSWAVIVASSTGWTNYRHQADALAVYRMLKKSGYPDDRIILIAEDDIAFHYQNPEPGTVRVAPGGENLYEGVEIDYRLSDLAPADFLSILEGERNGRLPHVVEGDEGSNIFIFWSGHGIPGALCWNGESRGLDGAALRETLQAMARKRSYRKLLMMTEACYSGGVMQECSGLPGMLFVTAADPGETSKADVFNGDLRVWMTNRFTSTLIDQLAANPSISLRDLYYRLFINTVGSHVMVYNASNFGNLYSSDMGEFIFFK